MRSASLFAVAVLAGLLAASFARGATAQPYPGITIVKETTNGDTTTEFSFIITGETTATGFVLVGGGSHFESFSRAHVTFTEEVPDGWVLISISCAVSVTTEAMVGSIGVMSYPAQADGSSWTVDLAHHSVTIDFVSGDVVACTFTNAPAPSVGGFVEPLNTLAILGPWLAVIGVVGFVGTVAVVARKRRS